MALIFEPHLMQLSDDVILQIMSVLKQHDIYTLSKVCSRLEKISRDRTLWKEVDLRQQFFPHSELEKIFQCFNQGTKSIALVGSLKINQYKDDWKSECLSADLFEMLTQFSSNLETLALEEHFINASQLLYTSFPSSLKHLSLENCELFNIPFKNSYFFNASLQTPLLESLNLNGCHWFDDHSLMALSKCPQLKSLKLRNCPLVGTCGVYILLAARFGFHNLKILDLRGTAVGDGEVNAFKSKPNLKHLYVDGSLHRLRSSDPIDRVGDRGFYLTGESSSSLEVLILTNTDVTDMTLRYLGRHLPNLQFIDTRGTKVTESGIRRLKEEHPQLQMLCDFDNWSTDYSLIRKDLWIDREFSVQEEIERPALVPPVENPNTHQERIEIRIVEPGMVRLRRIVDGPNPQPQPILPQLPRQYDIDQPQGADPPNPPTNSPPRELEAGLENPSNLSEHGPSNPRP